MVLLMLLYGIFELVFDMSPCNLTLHMYVYGVCVICLLENKVDYMQLVAFKETCIYSVKVEEEKEKSRQRSVGT